MAKDIVCGMDVDDKKTMDKSVYNGKTYHFCSGHCKKDFDSNQAKYVKA